MSFVLGLTGSIGMGKTTTAEMFRARDIPVWDADATVHRLYATGGGAVDPVGRLYPDVIVDGAISRDALRGLIADDPNVLTAVQDIVHPLVAANRAQFLADATAPIVVLDIPLLFETGTDALCDATAVVSTDAATQRARVLARGQMSEGDFEMILARQMPDAEKRSRATYLIPSDTLEAAADAVDHILANIKSELPHA